MPRALRIARYLDPAYWRKRARKSHGSRFQVQGDIHIWPDDHIEWDAVQSTLESCGCELVHIRDFLQFAQGYSEAIYRRMSGRCCDTRTAVAVKRSGH